jgi:thymidylate synthase (FAD)
VQGRNFSFEGKVKEFTPIDDPFIKVVSLRGLHPSQQMWLAARQDYSEEFVGDWLGAGNKIPSSERCDELIVEMLLSSGQGHWGPVEQGGEYCFAVGGFSHEVMQQARTHRICCTFDVQSLRYSGKRIIDCADGKLSIQECFYVRPIGEYRDRKGARYQTTPEQRMREYSVVLHLAKEYKYRIEELGYSEEHARNIIPYGIRQNWVVSFNARSLLHFLDLRAKADAEWEIQHLSRAIFAEFKKSHPSIANYYETKRFGKGMLSP